jgi:7tm Odorant receptor.
MVSDAAWNCDWVGTTVQFQRSLFFIIAVAKKDFTLTAGKFVPVCNKTMMNVRLHTVKYFIRVIVSTENNFMREGG